MSRYGYDYALAPNRAAGLRSTLTNVLTVGAIAAISAISGGAVALNLLGPARTAADRPAIVTSHALPASVPVAQTITPATPQPASAPANARAAIARSQAPAAATQSTSQPAAAPAPQVAPAAAVAAVEEPAAAHVPENELTFTHGYARRRAVQAAAASGARTEGATAEVARVESQTQVGRAATKTSPRAVARTQDQRRVAEVREEGGPFARVDQPEKFDFARHQALAFGETRDPRPIRRPPPAQGGLFSNSPSGFFGGLF